MKIAFSWDDGALEDNKLFCLHEKYEIPGMFFVPTKNREGRAVLSAEMIKNAESEFVHFGGHTENHVYLTELSLNDVRQEVANNKVFLEDVLGHEITDFCLPGGRYTKKILAVVSDYYSTIRTADTMNFTYNGGPLKPAIHFYPRGIKSLIGNSVRHQSFGELVYILRHVNMEYFEMLKGMINYERNYNDHVVMIWGHSWEIEKYDLWDELEDLMKYAKAIGCSFYSELFAGK